MARELFIVIAGCGRLGSSLANRLSRDGHDVIVIDPDERAFDHLSAEFSGFRVEGDATELAVLREAKIDRADLVIAATSADNANLMIAQVAAKVFRVPQVLARVEDPKREEVYNALGVGTICPTTTAADVMLLSIEPAERGAKERP